MRLQRELGIFGAVMMGLGAMVGTGVFVSIGIAAGIAGPAVILAVALAAGVAICNGLSSAQLAASHPVSGGTYEYGYQYLSPWMGFIAGWMFLIAKSASAATAALGFAGYTLHTLRYSEAHLVPVGLAAVMIFTLIVLGGIRHSNIANIAIVSVTLLALLFFVVAGTPAIERANFKPFFGVEPGAEFALGALFHASALMFVAYTGYGRIATLGEEVHDPERTIPKAIIITMVATMALYIAVAVVGIGVLGAGGLQAATATQAAPLAIAAQRFPFPFSSEVLSVGAITAMLGVLPGLEIDNSPIVQTINGTVTGAEVADLNVDGSPEIYVYVASAGTGSHGSLVAYSANRRKSLSEIYLPPIAEDKAVSKGYMGHDEFAVLENALGHRFPIYSGTDTDAKPTGRMRQLHYKLVPGEAGWILKVDRVVEY